MKTITYTLSDSIEYQCEGQNTEGMSLELTAPSVRHRKKAAKLKQGLMRSLGDTQQASNESDVKASVDAIKEGGNTSYEAKAHELLVVLQMSSSVKYEDYLEIFVDLLTEGICKMDGKEPMTKDIINKISFEDIEKILGEYLENFIVGSIQL